MGHHDGKPQGPRDGNPPMFAPAGNIYLTMQDWAAFCLDQMGSYNGEGKLLSTASYRMMETRVPGAESGLAWGVSDDIGGYKGPVLMHRRIGRQLVRAGAAVPADAERHPRRRQCG